MRPSQDFYALNVEHVEERALRATEINIVKINSNTGICESEAIELPNAADIGDCVLRIPLMQDQVWSSRLNIADFDGVKLIKLIGRYSGYRSWDILQPFLTSTCGHHYDVARLGVSGWYTRFDLRICARSQK